MLITKRQLNGHVLGESNPETGTRLDCLLVTSEGVVSSNGTVLFVSCHLDEVTGRDRILVTPEGREIMKKALPKKSSKATLSSSLNSGQVTALTEDEAGNTIIKFPAPDPEKAWPPKWREVVPDIAQANRTTEFNLKPLLQALVAAKKSGAASVKMRFGPWNGVQFDALDVNGDTVAWGMIPTGAIDTHDKEQDDE